MVTGQKEREEESALTPPLFERELEMRAARIKLVATDVDGVLTDGCVYYGDDGEVLKRFSLRDGMGVERLRGDGIETAFVTRESSRIVSRRAEKLKIRLCYLGVADKRALLPDMLAEAGIAANEIAYIGDDVNDAGIIAAVAPRGLVAAPLDAVPSVLHSVHYRCAQPGGVGAFRDFAEWILDLRRRARQPRARDGVDRGH
ncbi:MAG TPA: 3-deoxy-D-manno-octulosonate 8-phosphate phosphatase [Polyangia bacterium]|jgi:3-deoxy-D-manno-octulosonate 8-phosphate phosphatase (KDO 8-P phosphatase)